MGTHEIENGVFQIEVALQVRVLLGMRQSLTHQATIALARGQVVTFPIRGVELFVTQNLGYDCSRTKDYAPTDFNHPSPFTTFVNLGITQVRVQHPRRFFAWSAGPTFLRWRFRGAVVGDERFDVGRQFVRGQQGWPTIGAGLKGG
jgi:hypothetical protein